ncbi:response regulator transcription factor [Kosmotoga pacifica]|uniref:Response regulator ArlR n=1 Tax=Kosmotoga pacifica TaxID=1330330 RepID=A0A0G2ZFL5_9BACT|nr:response regulator transcription factor [Kosmotoga pacifica]AKI98349.1 hypothetical protein IX53_08970 [Kosmotoga pacifica]
MRILVIEDDLGLRELLEMELKHYGFEVKVASAGVQALRVFKQYKPDVVILDIMLPQLDGFELLSAFREKCNDTGIIILSVLNTKEKRLKAFELGADDYIAKPFDMEELIARIEALGRRISVAAHFDSVVNINAISLDNALREIRRGNNFVRLTKLEYDIFQILFSRTGNVVKKEDLVLQIWGANKKVSDSVIPVYIKYLREKLEKLNIEIETVRGTGYVLKI